jgi:hypothetical protein
MVARGCIDPHGEKTTRETKKPRATSPRSHFTGIIMRVKLASALTRQLSRDHLPSSSQRIASASKRELRRVFAAKYRRATGQGRPGCSASSASSPAIIASMRSRCFSAQTACPPHLDRPGSGPIMATAPNSRQDPGGRWQPLIGAAQGAVAVWLPWDKRHLSIAQAQEAQLLQASPSTMDRALRRYRDTLSRRNYGRTKPGTLLKHHFKNRLDNWDIHEEALERSTSSRTAAISPT